MTGKRIKLRNRGGLDRENNKTICTKQSLLVQAPYLSFSRNEEGLAVEVKSIIKINVGFFELEVLLEDSDKTIKFLQIKLEKIVNLVECKDQLHYIRNQSKLFLTF